MQRYYFPPMSTSRNQHFKTDTKTGASSSADDEREYGSHHDDPTHMLTQLCIEMKNCIQEFVRIMQEIVIKLKKNSMI